MTEPRESSSFHAWLDTVRSLASRQTSAAASIAVKALEGSAQVALLAIESGKGEPEAQYDPSKVSWVTNEQTGKELPIVTAEHLMDFAGTGLGNKKHIATRIDSWVLGKRKSYISPIVAPYLHFDAQGDVLGLQADRLEGFADAIAEGKVFVYQAKEAVAAFLADYSQAILSTPDQ